MLKKMSAVFISTPMATMALPTFKAAVVAAAGSLGYQMTPAARQQLSSEAVFNRPMQLAELENKCVKLTVNELGRDLQLSATREGVTVTFSRDVRGKVLLCVTGSGHDPETLHTLGEEMNQAVVQQYICRKLRDDMSARGFDIMEEVVNAARAIHLKVRHGKNYGRVRI